MEDNLASPIGICDVVASSGVSMRTLYDGFHRCHGVAPMTWLKHRRLTQVHEELRLADPATSTSPKWRHAGGSSIWAVFPPIIGRVSAYCRRRLSSAAATDCRLAAEGRP